MSSTLFSKSNLPKLSLMLITAVLVTVTGILYRQSPLNVLPLYISLLAALLQTTANRYALLIGGLNAILYGVVYIYVGIYASAVYAIAFSCTFQLVGFVLWSKKRYLHSTTFRRLKARWRLLISIGFVLIYIPIFFLLKNSGSPYAVLDTLSLLLGALYSILMAFALVEYTYVMLPAALVTVLLNIATMAQHPGQITFVVFSTYSMICQIQAFFSVRKMYIQQNKKKEETAAV